MHMGSAGIHIDSYVKTSRVCEIALFDKEQQIFLKV